ncbi:MAG TPA: D-hexose-6-phosphate mutarotase [Thiomicrorhabdus sp.]|nr:D-hexose-6-phosphate mutarotase [Thiomicrorhabdus sp.]
MSSIVFDQQDELSIIRVDNVFATASIALYGASVLSFIPKGVSGNLDLLWVSPTAVFDGRKPVRGGVPICWPWFGKHAVNLALPAHGFVRNLLWQLDQVSTLESGATELAFSLESCKSTLEIWPYSFHLALVVTVGETLSLRLITTNLSDQEMRFTEAFHSYFKVEDVSKISVFGLEGSTRVDTLNDGQRSLQSGVLRLSTPTMDSVFLNHSVDAVLEDPLLSRRIYIRKQSSNSSVVWNPGPEIVKGFRDIPEEAWPSFLCVESGNVFEEVVVLAPSKKHELSLELSSVPLYSVFIS